MRQKACLSSTPQCALALSHAGCLAQGWRAIQFWSGGGGVAAAERDSRALCRSPQKTACQDKQHLLSFFLSFFLSFVVSFVSRAFICHSCYHCYLQHSKAKQQSLCCLLACLLTCCCCCNLLQRNSLQLLFFEFNSCFSPPPFSLGSVNCRDSYKSSNA